MIVRRILIAVLLVAAVFLPCGLAQAQSIAGSIEGSIGYPSEEIPAMHIYAIASDDGGPVRMVETRPSQTSFAIPNLPAGRYHVVAYPIGAGEGGLAGGWTVFVTCAMTAQCLQHNLLLVPVSAGRATIGIRIEDWYASPGTLPAEGAFSP